MISISRTWRRLSTQLRSNLKRRKSTNSTSSTDSSTTKKSVRFYAIDTVYYTHSSTEYDRTPSNEDLSCLDEPYTQDSDEEDEDDENIPFSQF
jgi:hypothetical protein